MLKKWNDCREGPQKCFNDWTKLSTMTALKACSFSESILISDYSMWLLREAVGSSFFVAKSHLDAFQTIYFRPIYVIELRRQESEWKLM